jgi:coatomer subunit epsilon
LGEIKDSAATPVALRAVRVLASYLHPELQKAKALAALDALVADSSAATNSTVQFVAATIYMHEGNFNAALRLLKESTTLEQ